MTEAEELELLELEAEEAAAPPAPTPAKRAAPGFWGSALKGVQDLPTFGFGDELGAGLQAGLLKVTGDPSSFGESYRRARDDLRAESKAAAEAHPEAYYGAGLISSLPTAAITSPFRAAKGASLLTRTLASAANAGLQGGATGAGMSEDETAGGLLRDAAVGTAVGGGLGAALPVGGRVLQRALSSAADPLERFGVRQGRRVLLGGADSLSSRVPTSDEAVMEAVKSKAIRPFSTTEKALQRLEGLTEQQGDEYARILSELEARGVEGPRAKYVADQLFQKAVELEPQTMNPALPEAYLSEAEKLLSKAGPTGRLGLKQTENLKRSLQQQAKFGRIEETPLNEVRREIASVVRGANEEAVEQAGRMAWDNPEVQRLTQGFVPAKQRLGRLIEARNAAERGAARSAQRSGIGLPDYVMAAGGLAGGGPVQAAATGLASNFLRSRAPSAAATWSLGLADALRRPAADLSGLAPMVTRLPLGSREAGRPALAQDDEALVQEAIAAALRRR